MKPGNMLVRQATASDLPIIERQYGLLDNIGDPFCDTSKLMKIGMTSSSSPRSMGDTQASSTGMLGRSRSSLQELHYLHTSEKFKSRRNSAGRAWERNLLSTHCTG